MKAATALIACMLAIAVNGTAWAAKLTLQQAIAKVERETRAKVLSAETKHYGRRTIYRIKVLTREGKVRVIEVPDDDGKSDTARAAND